VGGGLCNGRWILWPSVFRMLLAWLPPGDAPPSKIEVENCCRRCPIAWPQSARSRANGPVAVAASTALENPPRCSVHPIPDRCMQGPGTAAWARRPLISRFAGPAARLQSLSPAHGGFEAGLPSMSGQAEQSTINTNDPPLVLSWFSCRQLLNPTPAPAGKASPPQRRGGDRSWHAATIFPKHSPKPHIGPSLHRGRRTRRPHCMIVT
jgi:hypothetical protein